MFSAFTTEPSTPPLTPPPESVQLTTPSSPEVPFAKLLISSIEHTQQGGRANQKFVLSHYEFQTHQLYPGSPDGQLISPGSVAGSVLSNSGNSSPFPDKQPILKYRMGGVPKLLGFEHFSTWKWGSRLGSGSLTPDGTELRSRLGSGTLTPDGMGRGSRLGSGCLTPDGLGFPSSDSFLPAENQKGATLALPSLNNGPKHDQTVIDPRVSFELTGEDVARCLANESANSFGTVSRFLHDTLPESFTKRSRMDDHPENSHEVSSEKTGEGAPGKALGDGKKEPCYRRQRSITIGSTKEFNFDSRGEVSHKLGISSEWWANEKVASKDMKPGNSWSFFPMRQPEVSQG